MKYYAFEIKTHVSLGIVLVARQINLKKTPLTNIGWNADVLHIIANCF